MKSRCLMCFAAVTLFTALAVPVRLSAQDKPKPNKKYHHYQLIDMGTFGGPYSSFFGADALNSPGVTVGWSATPVSKLPSSNPLVCGGVDGFGSSITVAFRWQNGALTDLGALPGDSNCSEPFAVNSAGMIVGASENGVVDLATGVNETRAVVWNDGEITDLGSFGGNQNVALDINDRGEAVGNSLNTIPDPYSFVDFILGSSTGTQTRAALWRNGQMEDLGTLGTGNDANAGIINERGQIAGFSYTNTTPNPVTGLPTVAPFIWDHGTMVDLGSFGGAFGQATGLNNRGQVIGGSSVPADPGACLFEDTPNCHPFLWDQGVLIDLNTSTTGGSPQTADAINDAGEIVGAAAFANAPFDAYLWNNGVATDLGHLNDCYSRAHAIDSHGHVVGDTFSCDGSYSLAFLWEDGLIVDLNTLIPSGSSLQLVDVVDINDRGEVAGEGVPAGVPPGNVLTQGHAFLLIPCDENHPGIEGCDYSMVAAPAAVPQTSPAVRDAAGSTLPTKLMRRFSGYRLPGRAFGSRKRW